jgi:tetratricopeptide (TPR) repeat protein
VDDVPVSLLLRYVLESDLLASEEEAESALAVLALLSQYSLLQLPVAANPRVKMHRVLALLLQHQHQHQRQQPAATATVSSPLGQSATHRSFDLSWCEKMVTAVLSEYDQSAKLLRLRDVGLLSQMQSLKQSLDHHGSACGWLDCLDTDDRAELLSMLGQVLLYQLRDYAKAKEELEASRAIFEAQYGSQHVRVAGELTRLGAARMMLGDHRRARGLLQRALRIQEANYDPTDALLAPTLTNLGSAHRELGEYAKARRCWGAL